MCDDTDDTGTSDPVDWAVETETNPATVRHEWTQSGRPCVAVVEAVTAATDRAITDVPPLHRSIDTDALDALVTGDQSSPVTVSFRYAGTRVWLHGDGTVEIQLGH